MVRLPERLRKINNVWFFSELPLGAKLFLFFIRGDLILLLPLTAAILLTYFISFKFMIMMIGIYMTIRYLGEMIYWFGHQFGERKYRPSDMGMKNLDNHALYILYQTYSIAGMVVGCGIFLYAYMYLR